jgi:glycine/D-amino acid oxidase-like deaminating enzyme
VENAPPVAFADWASGALNWQYTPFHDGKVVRLTSFATFYDSSETQLSVAAEQGQPLEGVRLANETAILDRLAMAMPWLTYTSKGKLWSGLRPMSPDFLPLVGALPGASNVFINAGHGPSGWTMSAATGDLLSHLILRGHDTRSSLSDNLRGNSSESVGVSSDVDHIVNARRAKLLEAMDPRRFTLRSLFSTI